MSEPRPLMKVLPHEFGGSAYDHSPARKHCDVAVVDYRRGGWPGREKFVTFWFILANGRAVGWNENPSRGWSFPVIRYRGEA